MIERLSVELASETRRRGCWGLLGQCTGAMIVDESEEPILREKLFHADGSIKDEDLIELDPKTGLIMPKLNAVFLWLPDSRANTGTCKVQFPPGTFIHPITARALPIEGILRFKFSLQSCSVFASIFNHGSITHIFEVSSLKAKFSSDGCQLLDFL